MALTGVSPLCCDQSQPGHYALTCGLFKGCSTAPAIDGETLGGSVYVDMAERIWGCLSLGLGLPLAVSMHCHCPNSTSRPKRRLRDRICATPNPSNHW